MSKTKNLISNILGISPVYIEIILLQKDENGITVIFLNRITNKRSVMEFTENFRLLSYYPL